MLHWEEAEDERGMPIWLRFVDGGPWGLILTGTFPRWLRMPWGWWTVWAVTAN